MKKSVIIIVLGVILYSFSLFNGFVWDDELYIQQNPVASQETQTLTLSLYFRPAMFLIHFLLFALFGHQPFFYHLASVASHIVTAILLFYLFKHFFKENIAFFLSLLFLVHPANVEAVCFASALQETLFTFAGILGLYLLVRLKTTSIITIFTSITLSMLSLLMKETGIVFFVLTFCYLLLFQRKNTQRVQLYIALVIIVLFTYGMARFGGENIYFQNKGIFPIMRVSFATRLLNVPMIILYYLGKFFVPFNLGIAQHWVVLTTSLSGFWLPLMIVVGFFAMAIGGFIFVSSRTRNDEEKVFLFFFLWFLIGLLPHIQIIPLNMTVAERWLYFPMIGLLGMGGVIIQSLELKTESLKLKVMFVCLLIIFFVRSFVRTLDWRSGLSLFGRDIRKDSSFDLQNNLGVELFHAGKYAQSKKYAEISTRLAPYWWVNWDNLGSSYTKEKNYMKAQECYEKAIQNESHYQPAYENLARLLVFDGKDKQKAKEFLEKAQQLFPENTTFQNLKEYLNN